MKKLNKNRKLIALISIITIIIIIGVIISANIIKTNIANEKYKSSNENSNNENLIPEYIKKGITLGGVTGTLESLDTSDATAKPEDILFGKTAYVDGKKITGTKITKDVLKIGDYVEYTPDTANAYSLKTNVTGYMPRYRLYTNKSPILTCTNQNDRFTVEDTSKGNGALTYPVGLITADEVAMGGGVYSTSNSSYYLYTGSNYWKMSPYLFSGSRAHEFYVYSKGYIHGSDVRTTLGVRPVLSLKSDISVTGSGTQNDPFLVQ